VPITVLLVDDFEAIRQSVCSILLETGKFQVIGEAADGLEAVQKAKELQPDLILLDIGLPNLNGIAAVPQIRKLAPEAKIRLLDPTHFSGDCRSGPKLWCAWLRCQVGGGKGTVRGPGSCSSRARNS
jgi:hypothetical protein